MRLIDADEIRIKPDFILYGVCGTPVIRCEDLARIINDMPTIEQQKWIPCSERLPRAEQEVLICTKKKHYESKSGMDYWEESVITPAIYEDGTILEVDSTWNWYDIDWAGW